MLLPLEVKCHINVYNMTTDEEGFYMGLLFLNMLNHSEKNIYIRNYILKKDMKQK